MALLSATLLAIAVSNNGIRLWPGAAPDDPPAGTYGPETMNSDGHITNVTVPTYLPFLNSSGSGAGVVVAPGGGYHILSYIDEGTDVAKWLNSIGINAFVLKYRVPERPQSPDMPPNWAPLQDAQRAMGMIRENATVFGLNASRLGFLGFSAGSHLTAHLSTNWKHRIYNKTIPSDDQPCRPDLSIFNYPWHIIESVENMTIRPELAPGIGPEFPPSFVSQAMDDPTAPCENSLTLLTQMKIKGAPLSEYHLWPEGGHGYGLCQKKDKGMEVCTWPQRAELWFRTQGWIN
eukprot:TRINITY_DN31503_c0_g1_i1.p1 TRINITY_DN31503_c0_g1~~TRINITY_DN31503_c0_g1_i1.p1  ORF type:complete len:297 (+),score=44.05 TRINITY_DN31503_c0_g1_i1:24-893(+)